MECIFQREGNTEMLKRKNLNVMCTFSSPHGQCICFNKWNFQIHFICSRFYCESPWTTSPMDSMVNLRRMMTHNKMDEEIGIHEFSLGVC